MTLKLKNAVGYTARWFSMVLPLALVITISAGLSADEPWQPLTEEETAAAMEWWMNPATTAEDILKRLNNPATTHGGFKEPELNQAETETAIKRLRLRYPLVSIRARAERATRGVDPVSTDHFENTRQANSEANKEGIRQQTALQDFLAIPKLFKSKKMQRSISGWNTVRVDSLRELHSESVVEFISKDDNGFGRFPVASPYKLPLFESKFAGFDHAPVKSSIAKEPLGTKVTYASQPAAKSRYEHFCNASKGEATSLNGNAWALHESVNRGFASENSTGFFKSIDEVAGFESHQIRLHANWKPVFASGRLENGKQRQIFRANPDQKITWLVNNVQLVSLLMHDRPKVYDTDQIPNMENLRSEDAPVRDLDTFETEALEKLAVGKEIVLHASENRIRMLGSIKCEASCIDCHSKSQKGDVLGAFSYEILRSPVKTTAERKAW